MTQASSSRWVWLAALPLVLAGCGSTVTVGARMGQPVIERAVAQQLIHDTGMKVQKVVCPPTGLAGHVGATVDCDVYAYDLRYRGHVTAIKKSGSKLRFKVHVPPPPVVPRQILGQAVVAQLQPKLSNKIVAVACQTDLVGKVGQSALCELKDERGQSAKVKVTVTRASFVGVDFHIQTVR